jgi:excisionase family DNA binding protein
MQREYRRAVIVPKPPEELVELYLGMTRRDRDENFWTPKRVADLLGKESSTVRQMIAKGELSAFRNGGAWLIYKPSAVEWLKRSAAADV